MEALSCLLSRSARPVLDTGKPMEGGTVLLRHGRQKVSVYDVLVIGPNMGVDCSLFMV